MKIISPSNKTIKLSEVAELDQGPTITLEGGEVVDVDMGHPKSVPATDENLAKAEATLPKVEQRPSLEVETEVHSNLIPRIEAHLARMRAWDLRKAASSGCPLRDAIASVEHSWSELSNELALLRADGFVAKTTPVTRIAARLQRGAKVSLREDQRAIFAKVYSDEQLDSLSVVKVTDTHVQLMAEDGSNLGLVRLIHVVVKP